MSNRTFILAGAAGFALWGLLHLAGGGMILAATWRDPAAGFAAYATAQGPYDALSGAILAYFAYGLAVLGLAVLLIAALGNRRNSATALAINTGLILPTELGLIVFLLIPGHLPWAQALPGFAFAALGVMLGGIACQRAHPETADAAG